MCNIAMYAAFRIFYHRTHIDHVVKFEMGWGGMQAGAVMGLVSMQGCLGQGL